MLSRSPSPEPFWQTVTAIGLTITPLLAKLGNYVSRRLERREPVPTVETDSQGTRTIVFGFGRVGRMVADMLKRHDQPYVAGEADIDAVADARAAGYNIVFGDVARNELITRLDLDRARALILTMDEPVLTVRLAKQIRATHPDLPIIVRARDAAHAAALYKAGASHAVPETLESSLQLAETALVDLGVAMGPVIASIHQMREDLRVGIKDAAEMDKAPKLRRLRPDEVS